MVEPGITRDSADGSRELIARLHGLTAAAVLPYRLDMADVSFNWSSTAPLTGIPTANGCDPLAPERIIQVRLSFSPGARWGTCCQVVNPSSPVLGLTNARYLLSRTAAADGGFRLVADISGYQIYENTRTLPRFFLVNRVIRAANLGEAAKVLHSPDFRPWEAAIIEGPFEGIEPGPTAPGLGRVQALSYRPSAIALLTHSTSTALLIAADAYYPGWEARIDGIPTRWYIADVAFRGIRLPAGDHRIEMRFAPHVLYGSALVSMAALLIVAGVALKPAISKWGDGLPMARNRWSSAAGVAVICLCEGGYFNTNVCEQLPNLIDTPSDFLHYDRAAQLVRQAHSPFGDPEYVYPPLFAFAVTPLRFANYVTARWLWFVLSHAALLIAAWLMWRALGNDLTGACCVTCVRSSGCWARCCWRSWSRGWQSRMGFPVLPRQ